MKLVVNRRLTGIVSGTFLVSILFIHLIVQIVLSAPEGPSTLTLVSNTTKGVTAASLVNNTGGYIYTLRLSAVQQNTRWKAYVGNVTGALTLDDASGNSIYQWSLSAVSLSGEVYTTRKPTAVTWANINCTWPLTGLDPFNRTIEDAESTGFTLTGSDNISITFNHRNHTAMTVGTRVITEDSCWAFHPWKDDAVPGNFSQANFSEVLLYDGTNSTNGFLVYSQNLETPATEGFDQNEWNFQMIVPENGTTGFVGSTGYYFYVELT